jgi:hypothetical protein
MQALASTQFTSSSLIDSMIKMKGGGYFFFFLARDEILTKEFESYKTDNTEWKKLTR